MYPKKINTLKDLVKVYGQRKSDIEISKMLDIPLDQIKLSSKYATTKDK